MRRQQELRRDVEAISLMPQASVAPGSSGTKGMVGTLPSWLVTNTDRGVGGADGGFSNGIVAAPTAGQGRALTEKAIRDIAQSVYEQGGEVDYLMSVPSVCKKLSEYLFGDAARVATLQSDQGKSREKAAALGAVNVFVSDFATLTFVPNRLQQTYQSTDGTPIPVADVFLLDTNYIRHSFLQGYRTEPLAKTGLSDNRQMSVDWTLKVLTEKAIGVIADVDPTADVTYE